MLAFEAAALKEAGVDFAPVPPRYRTTYFSHVFSGGYSAGYYGYLWSEKLDADTVEWFKENGGLTRKNGDHFRKTLLSRGGTMDAMEMYRKFRGRDAEDRAAAGAPRPDRRQQLSKLSRQAQTSGTSRNRSASDLAAPGYRSMGPAFAGMTLLRKY